MKSYIIVIAMLLSSAAYAHPGRTDAQGGHVDKKTGEYHFHKKKDIPPITDAAYDRSDWPHHWIDADKDYQDTRAEVLIRDNSGILQFKRNKECTVTWGKWICPYTKRTFTKASDIDIDHIVPLSHAFKTGGAGWSYEQKRTFANDMDNLIAVEDNINQSKGDKAPDEWLPPHKGFWAEYARRWIMVKKKYGLIISQSEMDALRKMLE